MPKSGWNPRSAVVLLLLLLAGPAARTAAAAPSPAAEDSELVYLAALRFHRPPSNQSRWLDTRLLPSAADSIPRVLDRDLAVRLIGKLGRGFCLLDEPGGCTREDGAELRVSEIRPAGSGRFRVVVGCRLRMRGGGVVDVPSQQFVIARSARGWRIVERGAAGGTP